MSLGQETQGLDIRPVEICALVWGVQIWDLWFHSPCLRATKAMVSTCMVPTWNHGGGGVMVWGCFAGDTVGDLFKIEGTLNQHGYHSILQRHAIPSGLRLVGPSFIFQQDNDPKHNSRLCKGYLTKKEGVLHQWRKTGQRVFSISGNSFKTVRKPFQVTTSWSSSRECQECAKQ